MQCKFCPAEIDYIKEEKTAYEENGNKHDCPGLKKDPNKPKGFPNKWTKKEYKPIEKDLELESIKAELKDLKELVAKHDEVIRAHTQELDFKKGTEMRNPEEVQR